MQKLPIQTPDLTSENIAKIKGLFPEVITEKEDEKGEIVQGIDFELLKQKLAGDIVDGSDERYRLDWPGKRRSILKANTPINKTLAPDKESSVNFENTENVYIEGDNFEVLKILQESYLNKIKMIYIDPPYNTGKDFVYRDNFKVSKDDYEEEIGVEDEEGGRLFKNTDTNGRFHSDWLSMMYERLVVARDLLTDDGVIFMSIDDNEVHNLRKIADEVFGEENFINDLMIRRRIKSLNLQFAENGLSSFNIGVEHILVYRKTGSFKFKPLRKNKKDYNKKGTWNVFWSGADRPTMRYELLGFAPESGQWRWSKEKALDGIKNYEEYEKNSADNMSLDEYWESTGKNKKFVRRISNGVGKNGGVQYWIPSSSTSLRTSNWTDLEVSEIAKEFDIPFDNPKNKNLIKTLIDSINDQKAIILDCFSGSATTAHAVMQLNAEDGGNRKFVMVQLDELTYDPEIDVITKKPIIDLSTGYPKVKKESEAQKSGYYTISQLGRERIRRAGKKIVEENAEKLAEREAPLDIGFRAYKVADTIYNDVQKHPNELQQDMLTGLADNIKSDKSPEDILTAIMLSLGLTIDLTIKSEKIGKNIVFNVADGALVACFDTNITMNLIETIAKTKPLRAVFRDASFKDDQDRINTETTFKQLSPQTRVNVI